MHLVPPNMRRIKSYASASSSKNEKSQKYAKEYATT
jgi:hypothetical protein